VQKTKGIIVLATLLAVQCRLNSTPSVRCLLHDGLNNWTGEGLQNTLALSVINELTIE